MRLTIWQSLRVAAAALLLAPAAAQEVAPASLEPVVITATRTERHALDVPASVDAIERDAVRSMQWRINLSESLPRVPGVVALNRQNYAQDLQISVRGFGARSTFGVRGVRLYLDGVPASMPDGQGQVSHFPLDAVERIEVLRGPFSALYGNSSGGVIAMTTHIGQDAPRAEVSTAFGGYGSWRAGALFEGAHDAASYALSANRFSTNGYREHSAAERDVLNVRAALDTGAGRLRLSINAVDIPDALDPLGLTRAQAAADPRQAAPQALLFNTRKSAQQAQAGAELVRDWNPLWRTTVAAWFGERDVTQFQAIPIAVQAPSTHPGGVIDLARSYGGADLRLQRNFSGGTAIVGIDIERLGEDRRGYENFVVAPVPQLGVIGQLRRDERNTVTSTDAYAQVELALASAARVTAGVRGSRVRFASADRYLSNGDDSGSLDFDSLNPVLGVVLRPAPHASFYASYGRGFETPTLNELAYRADGSSGLNDDLEPARSHNFEVGAKTSSASIRASVAAFWTQTRDEIVVSANAGGRSSFANAAGTRRRGAEASLDWRATPAFTVRAAATYLRATYSEALQVCASAPCTQPNVTIPAGNRLPGVPSGAGFIELAYRTRSVDLIGQWQTQSSLAVDDRNSDQAAGWGVINLAAQREWAAGPWKARAFLRIENVLDGRYIGSVIVNEANARYFEPAPGRSWIAGLDVRY